MHVKRITKLHPILAGLKRIKYLSDVTCSRAGLVDADFRELLAFSWPWKAS